MARAVDAFSAQIMAVQDLVLKLGVKTLSGGVAWTPLTPERWSGVVRDGDEFRVGYIGGEPQGIYSDAPSPVVIFTYNNPHPGIGIQCAYIHLPKTYRVSHPSVG